MTAVERREILTEVFNKLIKAKICPFENPKFSMDPNEPCPVCGDLGTTESAQYVSKCTSPANIVNNMILESF